MRAITALLIPMMLLFSVAGSAGCDGRAVPPAQPGPSPTPGPDPDPQPGPGPDAGPDPAPDSGPGPGPDVTPTPVPGSATCAFDGQGDPATTVLASVFGTQLQLTAADGSQRTAYTIGAGQVGTDDIVSSTLLARGQFIALDAVYNSGGQSADARRELVLLDRQGQVIWQQVNQQLSWPIFLGPSGIVAITTGESGLDVVTADGRLQSRSGAFAIAEAAPGGQLPIGLQRDDAGVLTWGWVSAQDLSGQVVPQARPSYGQFSTDPIWLGNRLVYLGRDEAGRPLVVSEAPGGVAGLKQKAVVTAAIPTRDAADSAYISAVSRSGWVLASVFRTDAAGNSEQETYRINSATGEVVQLVLQLPAGQRAFMFSPAQLDDAGNLLQPLRDDSTGGLFRSPDGATGWERLGSAVTSVLALDVVTRGDTYLIFGANDRKGGEFEWAAPGPDAGPVLSGTSLQVTRPGAQPTATLTGEGTIGIYNPNTLSDDGGCFAYLTVDADNRFVLTAIEVQSGRQTDLASAPASVYNVNLAWLGGR